ncbi:GAF and ANTAR domain-containing protein [soil metagenome]
MSGEDRRDDAALSIFGDVQSLLLTTESVQTFLDELARLAAHVIEPPPSCGITVRRDGQPYTVASSDERAAAVDETQYEEQQGPCLQALRTGEVVEVTDQASEGRWGGYAAAAFAYGVRCSLSLPLVVDRTTTGALNLYGYAAANAFNGRERQHAEVFAAQASAALTLMMRQASQAELSAQLEHALASRSVIDQALGVLMGQQRCSADEAFALLRARSQNSNRKLREVAAELISRLTGQPPADPPTFNRSL